MTPCRKEASPVGLLEIGRDGGVAPKMQDNAVSPTHDLSDLIYRDARSASQEYAQLKLYVLD